MSRALDWEVSALAKHHDRSAFDCGEPDLDAYLKNYSGQNQRNNISRTHVATRTGDARVVGFYTLAAASVGVDDLPPDSSRKLPRYPVPIIHLGRLAVDRSAAGQGLGEFLLMHAFEQVLRASEGVGVYAISVRAKSERAKTFYERYGFNAVSTTSLDLYISLKAVRRAFEGG